MRATLPLLPGEDAQEFQHRLDDWTAELRPETGLERRIVESMVLASWRVDRCRRAETAALTQQIHQAQEAERTQESEPIENILPWLERQPSYTVRELRKSPRGCRWMLGRWHVLADALRQRTVWDAVELHLALNLMGLAPQHLFRDVQVTQVYTAHMASLISGHDVPFEQAERFLAPDRPERMTPEQFAHRVQVLLRDLPPYPEARASLVQLVQDQIAGLEEHLELLEARAERDRLLSAQAAAFDGSATGAARLRYETAAQREFRSSLRDLWVAQDRRRDGEDAGDRSLTVSGGPKPMPDEVPGESEGTAEFRTPIATERSPRGTPRDTDEEDAAVTAQVEERIVAPSELAMPRCGTRPS